MICKICGCRYGSPSMFDYEDVVEGISEFASDEFGICPVCIKKRGIGSQELRKCQRFAQM